MKYSIISFQQFHILRVRALVRSRGDHILKRKNLEKMNGRQLFIQYLSNKKNTIATMTKSIYRIANDN